MDMGGGGGGGGVLWTVSLLRQQKGCQDRGPRVPFPSYIPWYEDHHVTLSWFTHVLNRAAYKYCKHAVSGHSQMEMWDRGTTLSLRIWIFVKQEMRKPWVLVVLNCLDSLS